MRMLSGLVSVQNDQRSPQWKGLLLELGECQNRRNESVEGSFVLVR